MTKLYSKYANLGYAVNEEIIYITAEFDAVTEKDYILVWDKDFNIWRWDSLDNFTPIKENL